MKTLKTLKVFALLMLVIPALSWAQAGTIIHDDGGNDPTIADWLEDSIHDNHHFDRCSNYNNAGQTARKSCFNEHTSAPRFNQTYCDLHRDGKTHSCTVTATVYCPGLGPESSGGWLTFDGYAQANVNEQLPPVAAGTVGTSGGVAMRGIQVGNKSCGCIPPNGTSGSQFFGSPVHNGDGTYYCP